MNYLTGIRLNGFPEQSSYLANLPVVKYLQSLEELAFEKPVTFFVGENGTGKSTLLERSRLHWALIQREGPEISPSQQKHHILFSISI